MILKASTVAAIRKGEEHSMKHARVRLSLIAALFAALAPITTSFADTSLVTLSITAAPITSSRLVYVHASDGNALILVTSTIAELP
jgi:hypothetical protein